MRQQPRRRRQASIDDDTPEAARRRAAERQRRRQRDAARKAAGQVPWGGQSATELIRRTLMLHAGPTGGARCHLCAIGPADAPDLGFAERVPGWRAHDYVGPEADSADHIKPRAKGGTNVIGNLAPVHTGCNSARRDMDLDEWFARHPVRPGDPSRNRQDDRARNRRHRRHLDTRPAPLGTRTETPGQRSLPPSRRWYG
ncbi:HNH endonuclease signature motif containing protein [Gordonia sp. CPCC 206044]|uniref:HNH endonuclease n=1 Tax=Gordonia sp. CPCC 206044 TaxID=3140793 RepID=UPI003AF36031